VRVDAALDPFNPRNGYNPAGPLDVLQRIPDSVLPCAGTANERIDRKRARQNEPHSQGAVSVSG
jgi:hypothetical protein